MAETKFLDSAGLTHLLEKTNAKFSKLGHTHTKAEITDFAHTHDDRYYTETEIDSKLNGKSNTGHTHDDRYYTESEMNTKLAGKSDTSHSHSTHLTTEIAAGADLNTVTTAGWYKCSASATAAGLKNCPTKIAFAMEVLLNAGVTQKVYEYDSSVPKVYIRNFYDSAWGEWKRIYTTVDKPTAGEIGAAASSHTHTKAQITDFPTSMPASDVYAWAKAPTKPSYSKGEVGLGNVDNTADSAKSVKYATSAGSAGAVAWANVSGKPTTFAPSAHNHNDLYYQKSEVDGKLSGKAASSHKHGAADITSVNASAITGTIAAANLPSFVDDVIEGYLNGGKFYKEKKTDGTYATEITAETGKIYVNLNDNKTYRWGGSAYVVISETIALGETSSTAYRGDRGKTAYNHSQITSGNPHKVTKSDVGLGSVDNTSDANKSVKYAKSATANNPIKTTGTGAAYAATVDGITALTIGAKFTMVPHTVSTTTAPTLNVSGLGAKNIRMRLTSSTTATIQLTSASFLTANKPVNVVYDGSYWVIDDFAQPDVNSLYGTVPISKGGTGATTAAKALTNLGAMPKAKSLTASEFSALATKDANTLYMITDDTEEEKVQAHIANTTIHITAAERAKWNAKADITIGTAEPTSSTSGIFYIQTN